jgi:acyl carrier protein
MGVGAPLSSIVSSRTPEGEPNSCPVCRSRIVIEASRPSGDAPCPKCGTLLWFIKSGRGVYYHESDKIAPIREKIMETIRKHLRVAPEHLADSTSFDDVGADSLDIVELVMELDEEFGINIPDAEAQRIKTVGEAIDYIARHGTPRSPPFAPGDRVKVVDGTFVGYEGTVKSLREPYGLVTVELIVFDRPVPVDLEYWQVELLPSPQ